MDQDTTQLEVEAGEAGQRLDQLLARHLPAHSRARLQRWIRAGQVRLDGATTRPSVRVNAGQRIDIDADADSQSTEVIAEKPQDLDLSPVYCDEHVIVIDKPAGLVVHPAAGNRDGTLLNALLHFDPGLAQLPRAGIVHRLDKDTTGLMVVARTATAHTALVRQLQARSVTRRYRALVYGAVISGGSIDEPIGRHPVDRKKMAIRQSGKPAVTHFRLAHRYRDFSLLDVALETGRTHQIRVHLSHLRFPIVGDPVYGSRLRMPSGADELLRSALSAMRRQALHAFELGFDHPESGQRTLINAPVPADFQALLDALDADPGQ